MVPLHVFTMYPSIFFYNNCVVNIMPTMTRWGPWNININPAVQPANTRAAPCRALPGRLQRGDGGMWGAMSQRLRHDVDVCGGE
jgi:hypothetical protein